MNDHLALVISFRGARVELCPVVNSDVEACELARRLQRLLATLIENPGEVRRLCACQEAA